MNSKMCMVGLAVAILTTPVLRADTPPAPAHQPPAVSSDRGATLRVSPLRIGDPAPPLKVGGWIQGEPVKTWERGKVYVVELWEAKLRAGSSLLQLSKVQRDIPGVVAIGVAIRTTDRSEVEGFAKRMLPMVKCRLAVDDRSGGGEGAMAEAWLGARTPDFPPRAFIVDQDSKVVWIGCPDLHDVAGIVRQVLKRKFDAAAGAKISTRMIELQQEMQAAFVAKDWDRRLSILDEMARVDPTFEERFAAAKVITLLLGKRDIPAGVKLAKELAERYRSDVMVQRQLAMSLSMVKEETAQALALELANRAVEMTHGEDASALLTLAEVYHNRGDLDHAIAAARRGLGKADGETEPRLRGFVQEMEQEKAQHPAGSTTQD